MQFTINQDLLQNAHVKIGNRANIFWVVGGAGSGKSTICQALATQFDITIYDLDAHIYGDYHGRFSTTRHPVNTMWASAPNGLAWLLDLSWEEFNSFNQAALAEYVDLMAEDLNKFDPLQAILLDGGICNPAIAAQVIPATQMVCLANPTQTSVHIWEGNAERLAMKDYFAQFEEPEAVWQKFLHFDAQISTTILRESEAAHIPICIRSAEDSIQSITKQVASLLGIN